MKTISKREFAYGKIRDAITYGELRPGQRLIEKSLCETFKVGRTPLREALSQLLIESYLDFAPNKGLSVSCISIENVKEIYEAIAALEGYATGIATKKLNANDEKNLRLLQNDLLKACDLNNHKKWLDKNAIFHGYLIKRSGNNFLCFAVNSMRNRLYRYRLMGLIAGGSFEHYYLAHEKILKYMFKKDAKRAANAAQEHVISVANNIVNLLRQVPGL